MACDSVMCVHRHEYCMHKCARAISTLNTAPDSYAARTNMPCVGMTFTGTNAGVASFCLSRVYTLTTTQSVYLLMSAYFTNGAMTASGSSGMAATRLG